MTKLGADEMLKECCAWNSPAVVLLSDTSTRLEGRFYEFIDEAKVVRLLITEFGPLKGLKEIRLGQYCGVSFVHRDRPYFFLGLLTDHLHESETAPILEMPLPKVIKAEMRRTHRVPVLDDGRLRAEMVVEDEVVHKPIIRNLSLTGALLEFDLQSDPGLFPFDRIGLRLMLDNDFDVPLRGLVRRCDIHEGVRRYGVLFPETSSMEKPPEDLVRITEHVEKLWLDSRRESEAESSADD